MKKWKPGVIHYGPLKTEVVTRDGARTVAAVWTRKFKSSSCMHAGTEPWPEGEANLNLILAAPDLLEALEEMVKNPSNDPFDAVLTEDGYMLTPSQIAERKARAVITKAKGL